MKQLVWLSIAIALAAVAWRGGPSSEIQHGNDLYAQERYDAALSQYTRATDIAPRNGVAHYNRGNTLYKLSKFEEAGNAYLAGLGTQNEITADAYYNLGNTAFRSGDLERAIAAYKNSLRIRPDDPQAKHNLEFALRAQQQQEQQQQEQQQQDSEDSQDSQDDSSQNSQEQNSEQQDSQNQQQNQQQSSAERSEPTNQEMSQQDVERMLESVRRNERRLQQQLLYRRLMQERAVPVEKDW